MKPPMDPDTSEADAKQLELARQQGAAYRRALEHMVTEVADDGAMQHAGEYIIGYAVEAAEGMYHWVDNELVWHAPGDANIHLEIAVCDASDGRFVPAVKVVATLIDPGDTEVGTYELPLLWHPMLYHYGRNLKVPMEGEYTLRVRIAPPAFMRHDEVNGCRFTELVEVTFEGVDVQLEEDRCT